MLYPCTIKNRTLAIQPRKEGVHYVLSATTKTTFSTLAKYLQQYISGRIQVLKVFRLIFSTVERQSGNRGFQMSVYLNRRKLSSC